MVGEAGLVEGLSRIQEGLNDTGIHPGETDTVGPDGMRSPGPQDHNSRSFFAPGMPPETEDASPAGRTTPDPIDPEALGLLRLLEGERVLRVWRTGRGFLVMTNLRCAEVSRKVELFSPSAWNAGPNFFYYNLAPPKVEFHRYLRLSEERGRQAIVVRLYLHDPAAVAQEIQAARSAGQNEWLRRRARAEAAFRRSRERWSSGNRVLVHEADREVVLARCAFCGNLMNLRATHCPSCGASPG